MKNILLMALCGLSILLATSCEKEAVTETFSFNFSEQQHGWAVGFADYSDAYEQLELEGKLAPLPQPLNPSGKTMGLKVQGDNRPDDLFMFVKRKVTGLQPLQNYTLRMDIRLASDAPKGQIGIGGAPGEAVFLKAGAVTEEPTVRKNAAGYYTINIDKGNQAQGGKDMKVVGDVAKPDDKPGYASLIRQIDNLSVKTNAQGECWLIVGTDSGYEGMTRLYYQTIIATLKE